MDDIKTGWAQGSMKCRKCERVFQEVSFRYSCYDKVEGEWPKCCGELTQFMSDWKPMTTLPSLKRQTQFVEWLKSRKIYDKYKADNIMRAMQLVWEQFRPGIRLGGARNPIGLELGETVRFSKVATIEYRDSEEKTLEFQEKSGQGVVVGVCFRCEGERIPARWESDGWENPSYRVGPEFRTTRRHLFYEVKTCLRSKTFLVSPDHIQPVI